MLDVVTAANEAVLEVNVAGPAEDRWERVGAVVCRWNSNPFSAVGWAS